MKTKYIQLEIPEDIKGFTVTYLYNGTDNEMHLASRDYEPNSDDNYPMPYIDTMCLE